MPRSLLRWIPSAEYWRATAVLVLPVAVVLLILVVTGALTPVPAIGALAGSVLGVLLIVAQFGADAHALGQWLERAAVSPDDPGRLPDARTGYGRDAGTHLVRLQRHWRQRDLDQRTELHAIGAVLEALSDPLLVLDRDRRVVRANQAAMALFGENLVGRDLAERIRHPTVLSAVDAALAGSGAHSIEMPQPVPVERVFEVRVQAFRRSEADAAPRGGDTGGSGSPTGGPDRTLGALGVLVTLHDITAIKRSEQMRADFVANASHELRTPLATLIGFIETLRGPARDDDEARDRFLGIMEEQSRRMSRLVNDLMSLSRIELDEHTPPTGRVDIAQVVMTAAEALEIRAAAEDKRVVVDLEAVPEGVRVVGDGDQLTQVMQNLIDNAIKYGRRGTEVRVTGHLKPGDQSRRRSLPTLSVAVRDQGDGIPKNHLPRLTERFYRVDPARSRALGGTGLGLAIVKHIVNRHRGRLHIESETGQGSTFTVVLPVVDAPTNVTSLDTARRSRSSAA